MEYLPDELLLIIIQDLDGYERNSTLCSLARVSRRFRRIATDALGIQISIAPSHSPALLSWIHAHPVISKRTTALRIIDEPGFLLNSPPPLSWPPLPRNEISSIVERIKTLGVLEESRPDLERLQMDLEHGVLTAYVTAIVAITPSLVKFELPYRLGLSIIARLRGVPPSLGHMQQAFHHAFHQLHTLELVAQTVESNDPFYDYIQLTDSAPSLVKLSIPMCCFITMGTGVLCPDNLPNSLRLLKISQCYPWHVSEGLLRLLRVFGRKSHLSKLESIVLELVGSSDNDALFCQRDLEYIKTKDADSGVTVSIERNYH